jgi:serine/threonine-protein kinase
MEARLIPGSEGGVLPFFSPNGEWLGYFADAKLKKWRLAGGPPVVLCNAPGGRGGTWGQTGTIIFAPVSRGGLYVISSAGEAPRVLATPDSSKGETGYRWPHFLPGGNEILFTVLGASRTDGHVVVQSLRTGKRRVLVGGMNTFDAAHYVPTGYLVYSQTRTLIAAPFDVARLELTGPAVPVVEDVAENIVQNGSSGFSLSGSGTLVYIPQAGESGSTLASVDRKGSVQPLALPPRNYGFPRFSPDGRRLAISYDSEIWLYDVSRETLSRLTFGGNSDFQIWCPDGKRVTFASNRAGPWAIFWKLADGSGPDELLMRTEHSVVPHVWSPDSRLLLFSQEAGSGYTIGVLPLRGQHQPSSLQTPFVPFEPTFSPDGRWLAYASNETGRFEVYVQLFSGAGGKWQISTEGGREPVWARNPNELFYRNGGKMMVVNLTTQPSFHAGKPRMLFEGHYAADTIRVRNYDVTPDGQRFVMIKPSEQELSATQINVVLNWFEDLKRRVGPGRQK